jgi:hypothetical protein
MLLLSWLAGVPLPVAAAVFDMGKRGHKKNRSPPSCANVHACAFRLVSGRVTFVSAVNFSSARSGGMSPASSSAQRIDQFSQI